MRNRLPLVALVSSSWISAAGSAMTLIAIPWFVLETTGSGARTGTVAALEMFGLFVSVALAGPLVDRYGARRICILADLFTVAAVGAIPFAHATTGLSFPALLALAFGIGLGRAPARSARGVLLPEVITLAAVPVQRGTSAQEGATGAGNLLGAPVGGALIAVLGPAEVLLVDAAALLVSAGLLAVFVPRRRTGPDPAAAGTGTGGYLRDLREALTHLRGDRLLLVVAALCACTNAMHAGLASVLVPAYGKTVWHDSALAGTVIAALGAGGLAGTLLYGWLGPRTKRWPTFCGSFLLAGPPVFLAIALELPPIALVVTVAICSIGNGPLNPVLAALKYDRIPHALRGRVFSALAAIAIAATPLGTLAAGLLLDHAGPHAAVAILGGVFLLVVVCPLVFPIWRRMDDPPLVAVADLVR